MQQYLRVFLRSEQTITIQCDFVTTETGHAGVFHVVQVRLVTFLALLPAQKRRDPGTSTATTRMDEAAQRASPIHFTQRWNMPFHRCVKWKGMFSIVTAYTDHLRSYTYAAVRLYRLRLYAQITDEKHVSGATRKRVTAKQLVTE